MSAPAQLAIAEAGPVCDPSRSQWFTPPTLAGALVGLAEDLFIDARQRRIPIRVLEPSAGRGSIGLLGPASSMRSTSIRGGARASRRSAIPACASRSPTTSRAPRRASSTTSRSRTRPTTTARKRRTSRSSSRRACGSWRCFPSARCTGAIATRGSGDPANTQRDWWIRQKVHCISRPKFGPDGGMDEILLLDLRYRAPGDCIERWL